MHIVLNSYQNPTEKSTFRFAKIFYATFPIFLSVKNKFGLLQTLKKKLAKLVQLFSSDTLTTEQQLTFIYIVYHLILYQNLQ